MTNAKLHTDEFDYVVVGAGGAGSIVAARLAEDPEVTVCLLEAGPSDMRPFVYIPAGFTKTLTQPKVTWQFKTEASQNVNGRRIPATVGKIVGGSGSINGMAFVRGQPNDYNHWEQLGNQGWGYEDVLPFFKKVEQRAGSADDQLRGRTGSIPITDMDWHHPVSEEFIAAAEAAGHPRNFDYNDGNQEGVGYFQRTIKGRFRVSSASKVLRPALKNKNLRLITGAQVYRLLFEKTVAKGAKYQIGGSSETRIAIARREVVVCGGTVNSARLLQISGIGSVELIRQLGVDMVTELPGVGQNLIDHYSVRMAMRAKPEIITLNELARGPRLLWQMLRWGAGRPNILNQCPSQVYLFCKSSPDIVAPDLQCVFTPGSYRKGKNYLLDTYPGVTGGTWQHRPQSRGFVRAVSTSLEDEPVIQPNYLDHPVDQAVLVSGVKIMRALLQSGQMAKYLSEETNPGKEIQSDEQILDFCRQTGSTAFHLVGTSKMGPRDDKFSVVDDRLRVHGIERLRIIDASIMPTIPSGNTYAATLMIAEKGAAMIRADRKAGSV